jgi:hypothetical protein
MRTSIIASIFAVAASQVTAQFTNQSAPFYLIVHSKNSTINGSSLGACHEGAAIEGLCLDGPISPTNAPYSTFRFNTSSFSTQGYLAYSLPVNGGTFIVPEPMQLSYNPTSNVAVPLFEPSYSGTAVGFDSSNKMYIQGFIDDTVTPPAVNVVKSYYRWYVCQTYVGYAYTTLAWVMGIHSPENPSCVKVDVVRVFA